MGSKYHSKFSGKSSIEGNVELAHAVGAASDKGAVKAKAGRKAPYDAGFMIAGGHAMTAVEIIRKD